VDNFVKNVACAEMKSKIDSETPEMSNMRSESGDEGKGVEMSSITVHMSAARPVRTAASAAERGRSHLRLTRRGRAVLAALATAPLAAAALWFGLSSGLAAADGSSAARAAGFEQVTVAPGQSLWQIAETIAPHDDPRDVVDALVDMNGLQSSVVTPGETLTVPPQYAE
jgi:hypothetical protein